MRIGKKIEALRKENHMSQQQLAETIHISRQAISKWENGAVVPDTDNVVLLSKYFQVPIEYLLFDEYDSPEQVIKKESVTNQTRESGVSSEKMNLTKKLYFFGIALGCVLILMSLVGCYVEKYYAMQSKSGYFVNAFQYLNTSIPLFLILVSGLILMVISLYKLTIGLKKEGR